MKIMTGMYTLKKGGAYDRFLMVVEAFLERNCEVHCLSISPIQMKQSGYHNHLVYLPFGKRNGMAAKSIVLLLFPFFSLLIGWREKIDLFIAFSSLYSFIFAIPKWILRKPMVTFVWGDSSFGLKMQDLLRYFLWFNKLIEYLGFIFSDRIVTINTAMRESIMRVTGKRKGIDVKILFNNIPAMKTSTNDDIFKIRARYGISERARVLVTASVLSRGKNIGILIKCLPKIGMKDIILLVAGESSTKADFHYKDDLKKLVKTLGLGKQVIFTGWLQQEDLWMIFRSSDLFVLPSKSEGMPNVMLEAMGCDLPCIGSNIPGIRDIFQYEELMFDPSDETTLADKIGHILSDHQFCDKVKRLCQERKEAFAFNWKERAFQMVTMGFNPVRKRP